MDLGKLPWNSAAIVIWLPHGEEPCSTAYLNDGDLHAPECNPIAWWSLGQAVAHVGTSHSHHNKQPWIKVGEIILPPNDVIRLYDFYKHHGTRK